MQLKKIFSGIVISLSLLSTAAHADIFIHSPIESGDVCDNLVGTWVGGGSITAKVLGATIKCEYYGKGVVQQTGDHAYSTNVDFELQSGGNLCPGHQSYTIPGTCDSKTGAITMKSNEADLTGMLENNGTKASLKGTVKIVVKSRTFTANVNSMVLIKQ